MPSPMKLSGYRNGRAGGVAKPFDGAILSGLAKLRAELESGVGSYSEVRYGLHRETSVW